MNSNDMQDLASNLVEETSKRLGVDAVFVLVLRKSDNTVGASLQANGVAMDTIVGCVVQTLGSIRTNAHKRTAVVRKKH